MLLASKGIFAKLLFASGWDFTTLTASRALLALPFFWAWGLTAGQPIGQTLARHPRALGAAALAGFLSYYLGALLSFYALTLISAGLERTLLFTYPAFVLLLRWPIQGKRPSGGELAVVAIAWLGVALAVGGAPSLDASLVGSAAVLVCALTLAGYFLVNESVGETIGSAAFTVTAMTAAAAGLAGHVVLFGPGLGALIPEASDWPLMIGLVLGATVLPLFLVAEGVRRLGAQRASVVTTLGPPTTILLAWWILGESMGMTQLVGALIIVAVIAIGEAVSLRRSRDREAAAGNPPREA